MAETLVESQLGDIRIGREIKIDRLLTKQDELMKEIKLLRFENRQFKEDASWRRL